MQGTLSSHTTKIVWLRVVNAVMLVLLAIQFFIGMLVNLFVTLPDSHPGTNAPEYFTGVAQGVVWALLHGAPALILHAAIGLLLGIGGIVLIVLATTAHRKAWIIISWIGVLGILAAGFNGASFLNYGHDFSSLLMSTGFLLAAIPYTIGLSLKS